MDAGKQLHDMTRVKAILPPQARGSSNAHPKADLERL